MNHFLPALQTLLNQADCFLNIMANGRISYYDVRATLQTSPSHSQNRKKKPELWKLGEMIKMADHRQLPVRFSELALGRLQELPWSILCLSRDDRFRLQKTTGLDMMPFIKRSPLDWRISELRSLQHGLQQWVESPKPEEAAD